MEMILSLLIMIFSFNLGSCDSIGKYEILNQSVKTELDEFVNVINDSCGLAKNDVILINLKVVDRGTFVSYEFIRDKKILIKDRIFGVIDGYECVILVKLPKQSNSLLKQIGEIQHNLPLANVNYKYIEDDSNSFLSYFLLNDDVLLDKQCFINCID